MLLLKLLFAIAIIIFFIAFNIFLGLSCSKKKSIITHIEEQRKSLKESTIDKSIIILASLIATLAIYFTFNPNNIITEYLPKITLAIQLSGFILAFVAATIAFRNYLRKSGDKLSYIMAAAETYISMLILRNEKDKSTSLFAIDIILINGERIRLVNFLWPIVNPLNLSAFETKKIDLSRVHLYGDRNPKDFNIEKISQFICITANGESYAKEFPIDSLTDDYVEKNKILLANRIQNIAIGYENQDIDPKAEYWLYIKEAIHIHGATEETNHVLQGFVIDNIFFLTNDSLNYINDPSRKILKKYCEQLIHNKKIYGKYSKHKKIYGDLHSAEYLINNFFWEDEWDIRVADYHKGNYCLLEYIEKLVIHNGTDIN